MKSKEDSHQTTVISQASVTCTTQELEGYGIVPPVTHWLTVHTGTLIRQFPNISTDWMPWRYCRQLLLHQDQPSISQNQWHCRSSSWILCRQLEHFDSHRDDSHQPHCPVPNYFPVKHNDIEPKPNNPALQPLDPS